MLYKTEVIDEPTGLVLEVDELKGHLRLNSGDAEDAELTRFLHSAREQFEHDSDGRILLPTTFRTSLSCWTNPILLQRLPVQTIDLVAYYNADDELTEFDEGDWFHDEDSNALVFVNTVKPTLSLTRPRPLLVEYTAGYSDPEYIPQSIALGLLLIAGHWYANREAYSDDVRLTEVPLGWRNLVERWRTGLGAI